MKLKQLLSDDKAVSPVIGVILMVAITVILAAVIGTFVLGLGGQLSKSAPTASFQFDFTNNPSGHDSLTVSHAGGDTIKASTLNASVTGATNESATDGLTYTDDLYGSTGEVSAGDTATIDETSFGATPSALDLNGATVRVVWQSAEGDSSATLGKWSGPEAS